MPTLERVTEGMLTLVAIAMGVWCVLKIGDSILGIILDRMEKEVQRKRWARHMKGVAERSEENFKRLREWQHSSLESRRRRDDDN